METFKILDGIFQLGYHQAWVLQASQEGLERAQLLHELCYDWVSKIEIAGFLR